MARTAQRMVVTIAAGAVLLLTSAGACGPNPPPAPGVGTPPSGAPTSTSAPEDTAPDDADSEDANPDDANPDDAGTEDAGPDDGADDAADRGSRPALTVQG